MKNLLVGLVALTGLVFVLICLQPPLTPLHTPPRHIRSDVQKLRNNEQFIKQSTILNDGPVK
jgi:hypothetical protein